MPPRASSSSCSRSSPRDKRLGPVELNHLPAAWLGTSPSPPRGWGRGPLSLEQLPRLDLLDVDRAADPLLAAGGVEALELGRRDDPVAAGLRRVDCRHVEV